MMKESNHRILCARATQKSVSESQFPLLKGEIERFGLGELFKINESRGLESITFKPNGNKIMFTGLDNSERLKSIYDISSIWINNLVHIKLS